MDNPNRRLDIPGAPNLVMARGKGTDVPGIVCSSSDKSQLPADRSWNLNRRQHLGIGLVEVAIVGNLPDVREWYSELPDFRKRGDRRAAERSLCLQKTNS